MPIERAKDLESLLADSFHKKLLSAAMQSLSDSENPMAFNNSCSAYRELVRHVLSCLAPQSEIRACSWYIPDPQSKTGLTRGHAVTYIIHGGLPGNYVKEELGVDVDSERRYLIKAVNNLSKYVHVNPDTFGLDQEEAMRQASAAITSLINMLQLSGQCRNAISNSLEAQIHDHLVAEAISETIMSVAELATHYSVEEVYVDQVEVTRVDSRSIHARAYGTIDVELQWGSNGDLRRGDGVVINKSFPLSCKLESSVDSPGEVDVIESSLYVDTDEWWDGYYDET